MEDLGIGGWSTSQGRRAASMVAWSGADQRLGRRSRCARRNDARPKLSDREMHRKPGRAARASGSAGCRGLAMMGRRPGSGGGAGRQGYRRSRRKIRITHRFRDRLGLLSLPGPAATGESLHGRTDENAARGASVVWRGGRRSAMQLETVLFFVPSLSQTLRVRNATAEKSFAACARCCPRRRGVSLKWAGQPPVESGRRRRRPALGTTRRQRPPGAS